MDYSQYIDSNPDVMLGKLVIKGTRIPVELVLEKLAAGQTEDELLLDYPRLTREAILPLTVYHRQVSNPRKLAVKNTTKGRKIF